LYGFRGFNLKSEDLVHPDACEALAHRLWRLFWLVVLVGHGFLFCGWWWLEPGGFRANHPRFWANRVAPVFGLGLSIGSLAALRVHWVKALGTFLRVWPAGWAAAAIAGRVIFPITLERLWLIPLGGSAAMGLAACPALRCLSRRGRAGVMILAAFAALAGAGLTWTQRPLEADTHPCLGPASATDRVGEAPGARSPAAIDLDPRVMVYASEGSVTVRLDSISLSVQPLLTFLSGSQDGCWSILARPDERAGSQPRLRSSELEVARSCTLTYEFPGQGPATLRVAAEREPQTIKVEAWSRLERLVYSHLNSFCDFEVRGHRKLALEFSPCPGIPIEVRRPNYPVGRPARFAFVEADRTFRVVEASSGEKGPFHSLARGRLAPQATLTITLLDQGRAIARISLDDWSSQAGTALSPTAGWGVPENAIEFSLSDDSPSSPVSIFVTLAGTSVGRGWDCVGHNPGTYRNRIRLECGTAVGLGLRGASD
jgi:hypothetical protein